MKLELKHLAPYLPYELKCQYKGIINGKELSKYYKEHIYKCEDIDEANGYPLDYPEYNRPKEVLGLKIGIIKRVSFWKNHTVVEIGIKSNGLKKFGLFEPQFKPILRPLSDYTDVNSKAMNDLNIDIANQCKICECANMDFPEHLISYETARLLFENHIDLFGLIDKGLAIDINTINPDKI